MAFYALRGPMADICHERIRELGNQGPPRTRAPALRCASCDYDRSFDRQADSLSDPQAFWDRARLWRLLGGRPGRLSRPVWLKLLCSAGVEAWVAGSLIEDASETEAGRVATMSGIQQ